MDRRDLPDLQLFQAVAEAGSFTQAARKLGRTQSGISQAIRALEERIGTPLLARTTRTVRPTEAGQKLLESLAPALRLIENGLTELKEARNGVVGVLRLTAIEYPARAIITPLLNEFAKHYPNVTVDLHVSDRLTDIVGNGFDAGIRMAAHLEQDMTAIPLGPDISAVVIGSTDYFSRRGKPNRLEDLAEHSCLRYRLPSHGELFRWPFKQGKRRVEVSVSGPLITNNEHVMIEAALAGQGLAYMFEPFVSQHLSTGRLDTCLEEFCPLWSGYHLYYPSRHQKSAALRAMIDFIQSSRRPCL
ncbi:LysR family transcriptional regulator [Ahrensia kielensis]|uniref:LysR family transcriptional regulator n=1 Tax=Ahrensia kielensis TaxID=76980 RepID=UPI00037A3055|nr:LysR family transcriptional regulator [Ahrensia kielensis]